MRLDFERDIFQNKLSVQSWNIYLLSTAFFSLHSGIIWILIELAKYFVEQKSFLVNIIMLLV